MITSATVSNNPRNQSVQDCAIAEPKIASPSGLRTITRVTMNVIHGHVVFSSSTSRRSPINPIEEFGEPRMTRLA